MSDRFKVNVFRMFIAPTRKTYRSAVKFGDVDVAAFELFHRHLLNVKNKTETVYVMKDDVWQATKVGFCITDLKTDKPNGVISGRIDVGSKGSLQRVRRRGAGVMHTFEADDLGVREFFFRLELPADSSLGFLVVQRLGNYACASALQQTLKQHATPDGYALRFHQETSDDALAQLLHGTITEVRANYQRRQKESRDVLKKAKVFGDQLLKAEDFKIEMRVRRPLTPTLLKKVKAWLSGEENSIDDIVLLPVDDDPDKLILRIEDEEGHFHTLHPGMIDRIALLEDLTMKVSTDALGRVDIPSAEQASAKLCAALRTKGR